MTLMATLNEQIIGHLNRYEGSHCSTYDVFIILKRSLSNESANSKRSNSKCLEKNRASYGSENLGNFPCFSEFFRFYMHCH